MTSKFTKSGTKSVFSQNNDHLFRALFKESADALQLVDPDGRVLYSSASVEKVIGYTPQEIQGVIVAPYIHPDDFVPFTKKWKLLLDNPKKTVTLEYRVKHKNGHWVVVETTLTNHLRTPDINAIVGNFRDISERRRISDLLKEQMTFLQSITNNTSLGLLVLDTEGNCTFINPTGEKILGYSWQEIQNLHRPLHTLIHYEKPDGSIYLQEDCPVGSAITKDTKITGEEFFIRPDKSFYPVRYTASPIKEKGEAVGTILEIEDITQRKKDEEELRRLAIIESQRNELMKLNKSKDEFIALASHQLRTPATAVKQYAGILLADLLGPPSDPQRTILEKLYDANERQIEIIDDILKIARIDSGKMKLERKDVNINELIYAVFEDLSEKARRKNMELILQSKGKGVTAKVDYDLFRTVLDNLVDNALKYSYEDTRVIVELSKTKTKSIISVIDFGVGIPPEDRGQLFERFVRLPNPLSIQSGGTGLGLYWVRKVLDMHKGKVSINTNHPTGTIFKIELPKDKD